MQNTKVWIGHTWKTIYLLAQGTQSVLGIKHLENTSYQEYRPRLDWNDIRCEGWKKKYKLARPDGFWIGHTWKTIESVERRRVFWVWERLDNASCEGHRRWLDWKGCLVRTLETEMFEIKNVIRNRIQLTQGCKYQEDPTQLGMGTRECETKVLENVWRPSGWGDEGVKRECKSKIQCVWRGG